MQFTKLALVAVTLSLASTPAMAATNDQWDNAGTAVTIGLMATGYGLSIAKEDDWQGAKQLSFALAGSGATSELLKQLVHEERPNGENDNSFPSGHTTIAFASAGFMHKRYGWQIGLPATLAAAFVGFTRVQSNNHYLQDVVAGAVIGEVWAWVVTKPLNDNVQVIPWGDTKGGGVSVAAKF